MMKQPRSAESLSESWTDNPPGSEGHPTKSPIPSDQTHDRPPAGKDYNMIDINITNTPEFKTYIESLCRLASDYVPRIRVQFAEKAVEKFQDETIRKLVLAYGDEMKKLDASRLQDFMWRAKDHGCMAHNLEDSCLNHAKSYHDAIKFLFEIQ